MPETVPEHTVVVVHAAVEVVQAIPVSAPLSEMPESSG
jgi:hypothetical protein